MLFHPHVPDTDTEGHWPMGGGIVHCSWSLTVVLPALHFLCWTVTVPSCLPKEKLLYLKTKSEEPRRCNSFCFASLEFLPISLFQPRRRGQLLMPRQNQSPEHILHCNYFISCQNPFGLLLFCHVLLVPLLAPDLQSLISRSERAPGSWEAPHNVDHFPARVLRADRPFLPLHKHGLECVHLRMIWLLLQQFCLLS